MEKTKHTKISGKCNVTDEIKINGKNMEKFSSYKCLGSWIAENGISDKEITTCRIEIAHS